MTEPRVMNNLTQGAKALLGYSVIRRVFGVPGAKPAGVKEKIMRSYIIFCTALTAVTGAALHAAPASASAGAPILPKGTSIVLRLETDLQSGRDKAGKTVLFSVNQNVYGAGHVLLLEKGAAARGHVSESDGRGSLGRAGTLKFTCDYALTDSGAQIPLSLVVTLRPSRTAGNDSGSEVVAAVSTGGHSYPNEGAAVDEYYRNRFADGVSPDYNGSELGPDDYYPRSGAAVGISVDPGRVLGNGGDATAERGQKYEASVAADTPIAPALPPAVSTEQLFTLKDKTQVAGILAGFDGKTYTVVTLTGRRSIPVGAVQSIQAVSPVPASKESE